ncbi:general secretion pathway protein H [Marinobacter daqiaonensis]|uniref:Type II secretion system protein H n=2 Tax=Marinobacter daqiaonensis TaxID=650891 RepID=A0A1I6GP43_9GAMM|nr:general secretion pathway protein H [Marinobacter daqiaonensis]
MIEILVVLVLVGLLASLAVVNLGGGSQEREMTSKIRELYVLMQTASEQAILNNQEIGLIIDDRGYRFVVLDELEQKWKSQGERLFQGRDFPEWLSVTLFREGDFPRMVGDDEEDGENRLQPDIVFFSSGETTPFDLEFVATPSPDRVYRLTSDGLGEIEMIFPADTDEI